MKDAFYFPHDSNARGDPNCVRLRRLLDWYGYGLFWAVIELLREAEKYRLPISRLEDVAYDLRTEKEKLEVLFNCELLARDETWFWSESLIRRMAKKDERKRQAADAGKQSARRRGNENPTTVERPLNENPTTVEREKDSVQRPLNLKEEKKEEEKKEEKKKEEETNNQRPLPLGYPVSVFLDALDRSADYFGPVEMSEAEVLIREGCTPDDFRSAYQITVKRGSPKRTLRYLRNLIREARDKRLVPGKEAWADQMEKKLKEDAVDEPPRV